MSYLFVSLFKYLIAIAVVVWVISLFLKHRHRGSAKHSQGIFLSKADGIAQIYYLLTLMLLFSFLTVSNASIGHPIGTASLVIIMSLGAIISAYYYHAIFNLIIGLFGLVGWWIYQGSQWSDNALMVILALMMFFAIIYLVGRWQEQQHDFPRFSMLLLLLSLCAMGVVLFMFSTEFGVESFNDKLVFNWQILVTLLALSLTLILLLMKNLSNQSIYVLEAGAIVFIIAITAIFLISSSANVSASGYHSWGGSRGLSEFGIIWSVIFNITIFGYLLGLILLGYHHHKTWLINLGSFGLILLAIVKYFDWFYSFMDKSLFFVSAGVLPFMVGYFMEKGRKRMLSNIKTV